MKKNYNPFRMWGSWIGAVIYGIITIIAVGFSSFVPGKLILPVWLINILFFIPVKISILLNITNYGLFVVIIFGFLLGWGINSLFRRFRK